MRWYQSDVGTDIRIPGFAGSVQSAAFISGLYLQERKKSDDRLLDIFRLTPTSADRPYQDPRKVRPSASGVIQDSLTRETACSPIS